MKLIEFLKKDKIRTALIIPVLSYVLFILTLYSYMNIASTAFFIMVVSTITIAIISFNQEEPENVKEN